MKHILFFLLILSFSSCEKLAILGQLLSDEVPQCIMSEIEEFEKEMDEICNEGAKVVKYKFQDEIVYAFFPSSCISDGGTEILNADCELLCTLGTIAGVSQCNGEEFDQNAKELKVIWKQ